MLRLGVLVSGGGTNLQAIIDAIGESRLDAEIAVVIGTRKNIYALERAEQNGIRHMVISRKSYQDDESLGQAYIDALEENNVGLVVCAGFLTVLPENVVNRYEGKIMNIHAALIPSFCGNGFYGLRVHEAALAKGVKVTGATVHFVTAETDAGPIILQKAVEVLDDDTPEVLQKRVMEQAEQVIYPQAIQLFAEGRLEISDGICKIRKNENV